MNVQFNLKSIVFSFLHGDMATRESVFSMTSAIGGLLWVFKAGDGDVKTVSFSSEILVRRLCISSWSLEMYAWEG